MLNLNIVSELNNLNLQIIQKILAKKLVKVVFFVPPADYLNSINRKCYEVDFNSKAPIRSVKLGKVEILQI